MLDTVRTNSAPKQAWKLGFSAMRLFAPVVSDVHRHGLFSRARRVLFAGTACALWLSGCSTPPVGADRVSTRAAYAQVERNALSASMPSDDAEWIITRYGLAKMAKEYPDQA